MSTSFPEAFREVAKATTTVPLDTKGHPPSVWWPLGTRETFRSRFLGGSPGPGPPSGMPSPSGQDELYGRRALPSNQEFYPNGMQVLTCDFRSALNDEDSRLTVRAPAALRHVFRPHRPAERRVRAAGCAPSTPDG